jgi:uncharacterized protein
LVTKLLYGAPDHRAVAPLPALAGWSSRHPFLVGLLVAVLTAGLLAGVPTIELVDPREALLTEGLPAQDALNRIEEIWGAGEPAFVYLEGVEPDDPDLLRALAQAARDLRREPDLSRVSSITDFLEERLGPLHAASDAELRGAYHALPDNVRSRFVADDAVIVRAEAMRGADAEHLLEVFRAAAASLPGEAVPAGPLFTDVFLQEGARGELGLVMSLSIVVLLVLLAFFFRHLLDTLVPLFTVVVALAMAVGVLAWTGLAISLQTLLILPLLLGLGVDYMFHVIYPYRDQDPRVPQAERFSRVARHDGKPILYAAVTTMIGFGSFLFSPVPIIRSWGLLIAAGVAFSFLLGFTLLPALYRLHRKPVRRRLPLGDVMKRVASLAVQRRRIVLVAMGAVTLLLAASITLLDYEGSLEFEPPDGPETRALDSIRERFGGQTIGQYLIEDATYEEVAALESKLRGIPEIAAVDGPVGRLDGGTTLETPETRDLVARGHTRIVFTYDEDDEKALLDHITGPGFDAGRAQVTGTGILQRQAQESLLDGVVVSIAVSFGLVALLLVAVHRNLVLAALTFVPLLVAITWQLGLQGLFGIPFNPITGVMTAMILGVGVDYSLHVVSHFHQHRRAGLPRHDASRRAVEGVGRPIVAATITTAGAFSVLAFSSFTPLRQFGTVAVIAVLSAVVITMLALPAAMSLGSSARRQAPSPVRLHGTRSTASGRQFPASSVRPGGKGTKQPVVDRLPGRRTTVRQDQMSLEELQRRIDELNGRINALRQSRRRKPRR